MPLFSAVSRAADSAASWAEVSFGLNAPGLGVGEVAARKLVAPASPAADTATTPATTMDAAMAEAINNVCALLIAACSGANLKTGLESVETFGARL